MEQNSNQISESLQQLLLQQPNETLKKMMSINIHDAKLIYEMAKSYGCLDSQEFIDWQDKLNAISVMYK